MSDELNAAEKAAMAEMAAETETPQPVVEQPKPETIETAEKPQHEGEKPAETVEETDEEDSELKTEGDTPEDRLRKLTTALNRERRERKKFKAEAKTAADQLAADKIERARLDERVNLLAQRLAQPAPKAEEAPKERDPFAVLQEHDAFIAQQRQQQELQIQQAQFASHVTLMVNEFKAVTPDYGDAYAFLQERRIAEMREMGANDQQIAQALPQEEFQLAAVALQNGRNPAEVAYQLAKARGYTKASAAVPKPTTPSAAEKLATIAKGQQNAQTLGNGGAPPAAGLSLEKLATMTDKEFAAVSGDMEKLRELFGG